mmetsp:Transcript_61795/g.175521  ORF Transcript_61795/g.175521 Transcript_61795/m.175521 type:complete len:241 (-) Transcript_61795:182-904(-)
MALPLKTVPWKPEGPTVSTRALTRPAKLSMSRTMEVTVTEPPGLSSLSAFDSTAASTSSPSWPPLKAGPPAVMTPSGFGRKGRPASSESKGPSAPCGRPAAARLPRTKEALPTKPLMTVPNSANRSARGFVSMSTTCALEPWAAARPWAPPPQQASRMRVHMGCLAVAAASARESSPRQTTGSKPPSWREPWSKSTATSTSSSTGQSATLATTSSTALSGGLDTNFEAASAGKARRSSAP